MCISIVFVLYIGFVLCFIKFIEFEFRSVKLEVVYVLDLLIYGESNEVFKDFYRRIFKELEELFFGKEIIEFSRVG